MNPIDDILADRKKTHGDFYKVAEVAQALKQIMEEAEIDEELPVLNFAQREALDMIFSKVARILCGDPSNPDHWLDIAGYSTLVFKELMEG